MRTEGPKKPKYKQLKTTDCVQWRQNGGTSHKVEPLKPLVGEVQSGSPNRVAMSSRKRKAPLKAKRKVTKKQRSVSGIPKAAVVKTKK